MLIEVDVMYECERPKKGRFFSVCLKQEQSELKVKLVYLSLVYNSIILSDA